MDGHWCVRALLQFLKRKVSYQKFALIPPPNDDNKPTIQNNQARNNLLLKQRARACTTCFLFTDKRANRRLDKPAVIVVMDLTETGVVALSIFRHSPQSCQKATPTHLSPLHVTDDDIDSLTLQFKSLNIEDKDQTHNPLLTFLVEPVRITPQTSSLNSALRHATRTLSDFSSREFHTIIVIGGKGEGRRSSTRGNSMSDSSSPGPYSSVHHPTEYDDEVNVPENYSWNCLLLLQEESIQSKQTNRPFLTRAPHKTAPVFDLDSIPIIVHLGGGEYPSACGCLPAGLLANFAWGDADDSTRSTIAESSIPRPIGFDLDQDAISDEDNEDASSMSSEEEAPCVRKRPGNDEEEEDDSAVIELQQRLQKVIKKDKSHDVTSILLRSAMKRCRIEEEGEQEEGEGEGDEKRKLRSHSELMKIRSHGSHAHRVRGRDESCFEEDRPSKRLFRGSSFDRVIPTSTSQPLATVVEGEVLDAGQDVDNTLNFSLSNKKGINSTVGQANKVSGSQAGKSIQGVINCEKNRKLKVGMKKSHLVKSKLVEPGFNSYSAEDIAEGSVLRKQASPKRKPLFSASVSNKAPSQGSCLMSSLSEQGKVLFPQDRPSDGSGGGGVSRATTSPLPVSLSSDSESPNTSGEESSTDEDICQPNQESSQTESNPPNPPVYSTRRPPFPKNNLGAADIAH